MKSKEHLDAVAEKREKIKLKTKHEIWPEQMTHDELKKLHNWNLIRYNFKAAEAEKA